MAEITSEERQYLEKVLHCARRSRQNGKTTTYKEFVKGTTIEFKDIWDFNNGRLKNPSRQFYDSVIEQARKLHLLPQEVGETPDLLSIIKSELSLEDERVADYSKEYEGSYHFLLRTGELEVTIGELMLTRMGRSELLPNFRLWRPNKKGDDLYYQGYYYEFDKNLYLVGNETDTAYGRMIILAKRTKKDGDYFEGRVFAGTKTDVFVLMPCVVIKKSPDDHIDVSMGEFILGDIKKLYPDAHEYLDSSSVVREHKRSQVG